MKKVYSYGGKREFLSKFIPDYHNFRDIPPISWLVMSYSHSTDFTEFKRDYGVKWSLNDFDILQTLSDRKKTFASLYGSLTLSPLKNVQTSSLTRYFTSTDL